MTQLKDLPASVKRPGWKVVGYDEYGENLNPEDEIILSSNPADPTGPQVPTKTGKKFVNIADDQGNTDKVYVRLDRVEGPTGKVDWFVTEGPGALPAGGEPKSPEEKQAALDKIKAETAASQASTGSSAATAAHTTESTRELAGQNAQRDANQSKGLGWLTDAEVQKTSQDAAQLGLTAEGLKIRREELGQQARNQATQNLISARNTDIAAANQTLNERKTQLDELYRTNQITLDQAKLQYQEAKDTADREIAASRLDLDRLTQQQSNQVAASNVDINRQTLEQRKAEAAQTQETNKLNATTAQTQAQTAQDVAAANVAKTAIDAPLQGAQTGAGMLNQRVQAGQGMLGSILGMAGQRPLVGLPSGIGQMLMGDIQGMTAQLGGGQEVYDTAARLVKAADPQGGGSPMAQQAYGVITQMLERYKQQTGQDHPAVVATQATQGSQQVNGLVAPQTTGAQMMPWNNGQAAPAAPPMIAGATPFMNAGTTYYGNGGLPPDQAVAAAGGFRAPWMQNPSPLQPGETGNGAAVAPYQGVWPTYVAPAPPPLTVAGVLGR